MLGPGSLAATRCAARLPRAALITAAVVLSAAGVRSVVAPRPAPAPVMVRTGANVDLRAEAFAQAFVRAYLEWDGRDPNAHRAAVASFVSSSLEQGAGVRVPAAGVQRVRWTVVVGDRADGRERVVTVAAATTAGEVDLAVTVARDRRGFLVVPVYPAVVGPVPTDPKFQPRQEQAVEDRALTGVVRRALVNYLRRDRADLLADLSPNAVVVLPVQPLRVRSTEDVTWVTPGRRIAVVVRARRRGGTQLTLRYVLGVVRAGGRWFVQSVMEPQIP